MRSRRLVCFLSLTALLALLCFLCFYKLDIAPIENWDESRHGISAYEMLQTGDKIVTTYLYSPDYWNLKPPLSEYFIALGYRIFGYNGTGFRFFSAFSWILSALIVTAYLYKSSGVFTAATALLGFSCATLPLLNHCARTGDADVYLCLFITCALVLLMQYTREKPIFLYGACLCFSLGFLTKSWHSGIIAVTLLLYLLTSKRLFQLKGKTFLCAWRAPLFPSASGEPSAFPGTGSNSFQKWYRLTC